MKRKISLLIFGVLVFIGSFVVFSLAIEVVRRGVGK